MRGRLGGLLPILALVVLTLTCAARLAANPGALIVDGRRPSLDDTQRAEARAVGNDLTRLFLPHHAAMADRVARFGHLPRWDARGFGGRPAIGNPQGGLFYPPIWVAWRFWTPSALGWLTVLHLLWGGLGTYSLARASGIGRWASVVAGGCFEAAPYVLGQTFEGHYPHVWAASWYPWAFRAALGMRRGCWTGRLALPPILALAFLSGHPQPWYYLMVALGGWALMDFIRALRARQVRPAIGGAGAWGVVLIATLGLIAVEVSPTLAVQDWGLHRRRMKLSDAGRYHLNPLNVLQLLSPDALGGPAEYFGHDNYWEALLSAGWVPLVLATLALARSPRRDLVRGWGAMAGASIVFAAGRRLGLFAVLYEILPGMDRFRAPGRALFLASLAGAVLAGLGVEALIGGPKVDWSAWARRHRRGLGLLLVALAIGQVAARKDNRCDVPRTGGPRPSNHERERARWVLASTRLARDPVLWLALGGTGAAFAWLRRRPEDGRRVAVILGTLALAELGARGVILLKIAPAARFLGPDLVDAVMARVRPEGPFRVRARDAFYGDLRAWRQGVEKTNLDDSFQIQHAADLYEALYPMLGPASRTVSGPGAEVRQAVLDRLNVARLVTDRPPPDAPWPVVASGTREGVPFTVYGNPTAMPRAYVVPRAHLAPDDASILAKFVEVSPRDAVVMPFDPLGAGGDRQSFTPASYESDDPDRVVVEVTTGAPGLLVLADTWMPGWSARLDGHRVPILRGNRAQRVVPIAGPGPHRVVMVYRPPGFARGLAITAATGCGWLATALALVFAKVSANLPAWRPARRLRGRAIPSRPAAYPAG